MMDVYKTLKEIAPIAIEQIERLMYMAKSENVKLRAAETLLDRAGVSPITKSQVDVRGTVQTHNMTTEEIKRLIVQRLNKISRREEQLKKELQEVEAIEVEFDEVDEVDNNGSGGNGDDGDNLMDDEGDKNVFFPV